MKRPLIGAALAFAITAVHAQEDRFSLVGAGSMSCGKYSAQSTDAGTAMIYQTWVQGFLSGLNVARKAKELPLKQLPDFETIKLYLDKYCRDNPLGHPYTGALQMFVELPEFPK